MIVALVLLAYAVLLGTVGSRALRRSGWTSRAPRLGITVWLTLEVSALASAVMAGVALTVPTVRVSADLAGLLQSCMMALRAQYASPFGAAAGATGAVLALAVLGRAGYCLAAVLVRAMRERAGHRQVLDVVGRADSERGLVVLDHDETAVYCLPGWRPRTVVTTGALDALDDAQLASVLAHERAHLVERHDLMLAWTAALARAFPRVPLFQHAAAEVARLVELRADDVAASRTDRLKVAEALLAVASGRAPAVALAAGGSTAAQRVRRLIDPHRPLGRARVVAGSVAAALALAVPVLVLGGPAAAATQLNYCPKGTPQAVVSTMR